MWLSMAVKDKFEHGFQVHAELLTSSALSVFRKAANFFSKSAMEFWFSDPLLGFLCGASLLVVEIKVADGGFSKLGCLDSWFSLLVPIVIPGVVSVGVGSELLAGGPSSLVAECKCTSEPTLLSMEVRREL